MQVSGLLLDEHRGLVDPQPHIQRDGDQARADQERYPPPPLHERGAVFADGEVHAQKRQARQHRRGSAAEQGEHPVPAAFALGGVFGAQQGRARPFPADGKTLQQPQRNQDQWGCHTDGRRAGHRAHGHGCNGHDQQRGDQRLLTTQPIPEVAEGGPADRPGHERAGEGAHRGKGGQRRAEMREEHGRKHQRRRGAINQEVVELDRRADQARGGNPSHRCDGGGRSCYSRGRSGRCGSAASVHGNHGR